MITSYGKDKRGTMENQLSNTEVMTKNCLGNGEAMKENCLGNKEAMTKNCLGNREEMTENHSHIIEFNQKELGVKYSESIMTENLLGIDKQRINNKELLNQLVTKRGVDG